MLKKLGTVLIAGMIASGAVQAQSGNVLLTSDFWKSADIAQVKSAVEAGNSPTEIDSDGYFPLYRALQAGTTIEVVDYLLDQGTSVNEVGYDNLSPLMLAARFNDVELVRHMLTKNVDLEFQDDSWRDALGFACLLQTDPAVFEVLMEVGMDPKVRDIHGRNCALSAAYLNPKVETIEYIATIDDITAVDNNGNNAFMQASFRNPSLDVVKAMMEVSTDPQLVNKDGDNALLLSAIRQKDTEIHQFLLDSGFEIDGQNNDGMTALHIAAAQNTPDVVEKLLASGADPNIADKEGVTPLATAQARGGAEGEEIAGMLTAAGAQ